MAGRPLQSLRLRQAIVAALRGDDDLTALGAPPLADRIYGKRQPATLHTFSKAQFDDEVEGLNAGVQTALEDAVLELSAARKAYMRWISSQVIADAAEANAWHGLNSFDATIG
jgi:hypothetical protein